jgi:hypothetical protein
MRFSATSRSLTALGIFGALLASSPVLAYRPFDSTDADVAKAGDLEMELGPVGRLREGSKRIRAAPAVVANYGLAHDRELVLEGRREVALDREEGEPRSSIVDNGVFVKQVLRPGVLQDAAGPSVATEYGLLLPSVHGEKGTGASLAGIVSQRTEVATLHLNAALEWTREHEPGAFLGAILEGPRAWAVRRAGARHTAHELEPRRRHLAGARRPVVRPRRAPGARGGRDRARAAHRIDVGVLGEKGAVT